MTGWEAHPHQTDLAARAPVVSVIGTHCARRATARVEVRARVARQTHQYGASGSLYRHALCRALAGRECPARASNPRRWAYCARVELPGGTRPIVRSQTRVPHCVSRGAFRREHSYAKFGVKTSTVRRALDGIRWSHPFGGCNRRARARTRRYHLFGGAVARARQRAPAPVPPGCRVQVRSSASTT